MNGVTFVVFFYMVALTFSPSSSPVLVPFAFPIMPPSRDRFVHSLSVSPVAPPHGWPLRRRREEERAADVTITPTLRRCRRERETAGPSSVRSGDERDGDGGQLRLRRGFTWMAGADGLASEG